MATANTIVLVVDDKPAIAELLKYSLHEDEWIWHSVPSLAQAWDFIGRERPDVLLQESMLRQEGGMRLLARLRGAGGLRARPVILLAAECSDAERAAPPSVPEFIPQPPPEEAPDERLLRSGRLVLDPLSCSVRVGAHKVEVRHAEYRLLRFLLCHPGQVFSRAQLLEHLWESHASLDQRTVDVHVLRLRKALGRAKSLVKTVRGAGYMLAPS
ncbi:winged helix-turn-helix transcriptional regulator [Massilia yuzhufengensis]|uniref:Two-component system, OmpR family, phosphate regulon response regulator PhoB n=1 Tax=Massilia yuzhufengensis TaxID=1164594 RepID=A0A1I1TXG5_9BURK|nr:response regulator transcription factor [Massilia yuzhufengensis]SFD61113.1 two-component system, OmpR family, phosphate regulon response regulator PhoB [Massilia yuzhufengensis]